MYNNNDNNNNMNANSFRKRHFGGAFKKEFLKINLLL